MTVPTRPVQDAIIDPVWGQWVHDNLNRQVTRYEAPLSFTSWTVDTTGNFLTGNLILPTVAYARLLIVEFAGLVQLTAPVDLWLYTPGTVASKRVRAAVNGQTANLSAHLALAAGASGNNYCMKVTAAAASSTFSLGGGADLNYLSITAIPVNTL